MFYKESERSRQRRCWDLGALLKPATTGVLHLNHSGCTTNKKQQVKNDACSRTVVAHTFTPHSVGRGRQISMSWSPAWSHAGSKGGRQTNVDMSKVNVGSSNGSNECLRFVYTFSQLSSICWTSGRPSIHLFFFLLHSSLQPSCVSEPITAGTMLGTWSKVVNSPS